MAETDSKFIVRNATVEDLTFPTRFAVENCWRPFGPGDYYCAYSYYPKGFYVGEYDGQVVSHLMTISYPGHSTHCGSYIVLKEHRNKGYGVKMFEAAAKNVDRSHTVGLDSLPYMITLFESYGFRIEWENYIANLTFEKVLASLSAPSDLVLKPIRSIAIEKLVDYDANVFGCSRRVLIENWIKIPGSLGWVVLDASGTVVGYTVVRPIILRAGMEIGMNMAPLYADNNKIAGALLRQAAEVCTANEAVSATSFLLICTRGAEHSTNSSKLFETVQAEFRPFASRMYSEGPPKKGQLAKIYGIMHPTFD